MLNNWQCTCAACPTQYEGYLDTGEHVYFRYRFGYAALYIDGVARYGKAIGDSLDGVLGHTEVMDLVTPWLEQWRSGMREDFDA